MSSAKGATQTDLRPSILLSSDAETISKLWYVLPKPFLKRDGWLVYTSDFVLAMIPGSSGLGKRTLVWRLVGVSSMVVIAILQTVVVFLSKIPVIGSMISLVAQ